MARQADPINHDGITTVGTVGSKAVQYGAMGALAAVVVPAVLAVATVALAYAAVTTIAAGTVAAVAGGVALGIGAVISGIMAAGSFGFAGAAAVGGGFLGALKGADKVSRENSAFRQRVTERLNGHENKEAKLFNDGEIKGIDEGYALAMQDMQPQLQAAFQKGQETIVQQIQEHMMQAAEAQQQAPAQALVQDQPQQAKLADKFECKAACKAEAVIQERQEKAAQPNQVM